MEDLRLNSFAVAVHENAVAHGWWEEERGLPEVLMLCVSELNVTCGSRTFNPEEPEAPCTARSKKPEGVAVELADCVIRILDYCGHAGIDIEEAIRIKHEYNKTRPYRHGGKKC